MEPISKRTTYESQSRISGSLTSTNFKQAVELYGRCPALMVSWDACIFQVRIEVTECEFSGTSKNVLGTTEEFSCQVITRVFIHLSGTQMVWQNFHFLNL